MRNLSWSKKIIIIILIIVIELVSGCSQKDTSINKNPLSQQNLENTHTTQTYPENSWPSEYQVLFSEDQALQVKQLFSLDMSKSEVQIILKEKNIKIIRDEEHGNAGSSLWGEQIHLFFDKNQKLKELFVNSMAESSKGLRIGDNIDKVYMLYGKEHKTFDEQDNSILQYIYSSNDYNISINKDKVVVGMGIKSLDTQSNTNDSADILKTKQSSIDNEDSKQNKLGNIEWPKFSFEDYSDERDIVKNYNKDAIKDVEDGKYGSTKKVEIAISLEDLNSDGKKEIIAILFHPYFSGYQANGLIKIFENSGKEYKELSNPMRINININSDGSQKEFGVSNNSSLSWKDIMIGKKVWKWQGQWYDVAST